MISSRWIALVITCGIATVASTLATSAQQSTAPGEAAKVDLSTRYRFQERPTTEATPDGEGVVGPYRVALREKLTKTTDQPQGAPVRMDRTIQATYQERPAEISSLDEQRVIAAVRRYEKVAITPDPESKPSGPKPFDDLLVWYQERSGDAPLVLSLKPNRMLSGVEYLYAAGQVFVPDLVFALPELPLRIGDSYQVSRAGMEALLGIPIGQGSMTSKLLSLTDDPAAPGVRKLATFDIVGRVATTMGTADLHAQLRFSCVPTLDADATARGSTIQNAPGRISRLSLAHEIEGGGTRTAEGVSPRFQMRRELVLSRTTEDPGPPLPVPSPAPSPTPENSWLTYRDPEEKFQFLHPQELQPVSTPAPGVIRFERPRRDSVDVVTIQLASREQADPDAMRKGRFEAWAEERTDVVAGSAGWLPEAEWPGQKVYRFEAALTGQAGGGAQVRSHFDGYIVHSGRDEALYVEALTAEDPPTPFRDQVESMIKTFRFSGSTTPPEPPPAR